MRLEIMKRNSVSHDRILVGHLNAKEARVRQQEASREAGRQNYETKLLQESESCARMVSQLRELESREKEWMLRFKVTQSREKFAALRKRQIIQQPIEQIL